MSGRLMRRSLIAAMGVCAALALAPVVAQAAEWTAPHLYRNTESVSPREHIPWLSWGTLKLENAALGTITCVNISFGAWWQETEPGHSSERTYGEVLEWTGTGFTSKEGTNSSDRCASEQGFFPWAAVEPPLKVVPELAEVKEAGTERERVVIKSVGREPPSVPWKQEAIGELAARGREVFKLKTGIGSPNCYPGIEITEKPKNGTEKETEERVKPAPPGCMRINIAAPEFGFEEEFQGTLSELITNGASNGLNPTTLTMQGVASGELESVAGMTPTTSEFPAHVEGYRNEELLTIGAR